MAELRDRKGPAWPFPLWDPACKPEGGAFEPVIDRNRCEGKGDCIRVCPYTVFTIAELPRDARSELSLLGQIKGRVHGWQQAFATNPAACHACGLCVAACPERAIKLTRA
jgi:4Fe-4S ferredoxin